MTVDLYLMALETQGDTEYMQNKEDQKLTHSFVPNDPSWMKEIEGPNQRCMPKCMPLPHP